MAIVEEGDFEVRSSELKTGLSSNYESEEIDVNIVMSKLLQPSNPSSFSSFSSFFNLCL